MSRRAAAEDADAGRDRGAVRVLAAAAAGEFEQQAGDGAGLQQRDIGIEEKNVAGLPFQRPFSLKKRVTRAELRLLNDPKAKAFTENFTGQWLGLRDIAVEGAGPMAPLRATSFGSAESGPGGMGNFGE